jgi:TonB family protein
MAKIELETFFERLMAEPQSGFEGSPSVRTRVALSTALAQWRSAPIQDRNSTISELAAHLSRAPDSLDDDPFIATLARDPEALYDLEAAQSFLDRVSVEEQPVPEDLIGAVVGDAVDQRKNWSSRRWKSPLVWASAIAALGLFAAVGSYIYETANRQNAALATSRSVSRTISTSPNQLGTEIQGTGPRQGVAPTVPYAASHSSPSIAPDKQSPPPVYTSPDPPVPLNSHFVTATDYPAISMRLQEQGTVKVKYRVQVDGTVGDCQVDVSSGYPRLDDAACVMVRRWLFKPATVMGGSPVEAWLDATITFQLK